MSDSLWPHGLQHTRLLHPSQSPGLHVHWITDVTQLSHPVLLSSPSAFTLSQYQGFFNEPAVCVRWPNYQSFSFSISPSNEYSELISFGMDWFDLAVPGLLRVFSRTTVWKCPFLSAQPSLWSQSHIRIWLLEKPQLWLHRPLSARWCCKSRHACVLSCFTYVWLFVTPWTVAHQVPLSMEFSKQEYWSGNIYFTIFSFYS